MDVPPAGIGARLEHGPEPPTGITLPDAGHRLPHRRRVVGKIVQDQYPADFAPWFLPPLDPEETGEPGRHLVSAEAE